MTREKTSIDATLIQFLVNILKTGHPRGLPQQFLSCPAFSLMLNVTQEERRHEPSIKVCRGTIFTSRLLSPQNKSSCNNKA